MNLNGSLSINWILINEYFVVSQLAEFCVNMNQTCIKLKKILLKGHILNLFKLFFMNETLNFSQIYIKAII